MMILESLEALIPMISEQLMVGIPGLVIHQQNRSRSHTVYTIYTIPYFGCVTL